MEAIRQTVKVKNHTINIILPDNFNADEVDVIILPSEKKEYSIPKWQIDQVRERTENYLKNPENVTDINDFLKEIDNDGIMKTLPLLKGNIYSGLVKSGSFKIRCVTY